MKENIFKRVGMLSSLFRALDLAIVLAASAIAYFFRFGSFEVPSNYWLFVLVLAVLTGNIFSSLSVYDAWRGKRLFPELTRISLAWLFVTLTIATLTFITKTGQEFSRIWAGYTFLIGYVGFICSRVVARFVIRRLLARGFNQKYVVVVGAGKLGLRVCKAMREENWAGLVPVALFDDKCELANKVLDGTPVVGGLDQLVDFIENNRQIGSTPIDQVWIALPLSAHDKIEEVQRSLLNTATKVYFVPDIYGFNLASYEVGETIGVPIMNMSAPIMSGGSASLKRLEDIVIASLLLCILSPIFILFAFMIKRDSPGPILFKQRRYGIHGEEIIVYKFRSMTVTEDDADVKQAQRNDTRVTKVGKLLRQTSLDELPQLINVLMGDMSLVGPRPHAVAHNEFYRNKVQGYMVRHQVRPGITGWAQVNGLRGETAQIEDMEERIRYDLEYIRNWNLFLDIRILLKTIPTLIKNDNTY